MHLTIMLLAAGLLALWALTVFLGVPRLCQYLRQALELDGPEPTWFDAVTYTLGFLVSSAIASAVLLIRPF